MSCDNNNGGSVHIDVSESPFEYVGWLYQDFYQGNRDRGQGKGRWVRFAEGSPD